MKSSLAVGVRAVNHGTPIALHCGGFGERAIMEVWKEIPRFPGYDASSDGRIGSRRRHGSIGDKRKILKPSAEPPSSRKNGGVGYLRYALCLNGKNVGVRGHTLVLEAFVGVRPEGMQCRHLNGDSHDNRIANLRWGTAKENMADARKHGAIICGSRSHLAKRTEAQIRVIKDMLRIGFSQTEVGRIFDIDHRQIFKIDKGITWKHV